MSLGDQEFSRSAKIILGQYLAKEEYSLEPLEIFLENIQDFDLHNLQSDADKKAFWINVYNGLTNYQIVKNELSESVWEKQDFFTDQCLLIANFAFSLDDIEHGILRRNGPKKKEKPDQFFEGDMRLRFMVKTMDYRVHFALNCGSLSCPPIAFYSKSEIDQELRVAEEGFSTAEFVINHKEKTIDCSSIFLWYRSDFGNHYLNDSVLSQYTVNERPYIWKIQ